MISTRKWALALCLALSCLKYSNAQDVTGNLIYSTVNPPPPGSVYSWSGFINTESGGGGLSGGNIPGYNSALGQFMFGYTQGTINYSMAVSSALSGTGIQITGIQYGLQYFNQDYSRGTLTSTWTLRGNGNNTLESYYHVLPQTTLGWTSFDQTKTFTSPYSLNTVGNLDFSISGQDDRFWAGYYGPQVRNPYARLTYGVDQCSTNPLSSPTCAGFSDALAAKITAPATTESVATATTTPVTAAITSTTIASGTSSANRSAAVASSSSSLRIASIARAVNESTAATVQATVQQSIDQSQNSSQESSSTMGSATRATDSAAADNPTAGFTRPGDPAMAARGLTAVIPQETPSEPKARPKSTQPPSELAGGINVAQFQMAVDLTAYTNTVMRDAAFYAPREIYRGQQTVDNRQALRALGSDARHQDMVDQQYRR